ncbi:hypothetical protein QRK81_18375 [Mycobacteroides abscessus]|nr:hypothetical protein [Mycobacteroides abscessus]
MRFILTALVLGMCVWWLFEIASSIGSAPVRDAEGNITLDQYQRAKDILSLVLPFLTLALGYWFGSAGREHAEETARSADQKLNAAIQVSDDRDILKKAMEQYPEAFK